MAKLVKGVNDIASLYPELVKEWDYDKNDKISPSDFTKGSKQKVWWKCSKCGNEWEAIISSRTHGAGCPVCGVRKQGESFKKARLIKNGSLRETNPELCIEWNYEKNRDIFRNISLLEVIKRSGGNVRKGMNGKLRLAQGQRGLDAVNVMLDIEYLYLKRQLFFTCVSIM